MFCVASPKIIRAAPKEGPVDGGYMVTILGKGMNALDVANPGQGLCRFEGVGEDVEIESISPDGKMLQCKAPPARGAAMNGQPVPILVALNGQNFVGADGDNASNLMYKYNGKALITCELLSIHCKLILPGLNSLHFSCSMPYFSSSPVVHPASAQTFLLLCSLSMFPCFLLPS